MNRTWKGQLIAPQRIPGRTLAAAEIKRWRDAELINQNECTFYIAFNQTNKKVWRIATKSIQPYHVGRLVTGTHVGEGGTAMQCFVYLTVYICLCVSPLSNVV